MKRVFASLLLTLIFSGYATLPLAAHAAIGMVNNVSASVTVFTTTANVKITYDYKATGGITAPTGFKIRFGKDPSLYSLCDPTNPQPSWCETKSVTFPNADATAQVVYVTLVGLTAGTYYYDVLDTNGSDDEYVSKSTFIVNAGTTAAAAPTIFTCSDGKDNDGDGFVDFPGDSDCASAESNETCDTINSYCFLAPLPIGGNKSLVNKFYFTGSDTPLPEGEAATNFGKYVNGVFTFAIGIAGALAVVLIVVGGIQYMSTDNFAEKAEGKGRIINAIGGLVVLIGAYMLLNTINPNLINLHFQVSEVSLEATGIIEISPESFATATGLTILSSNEYMNMAADAATAKGLDPCIAKAIVSKESGGKPNIVGHNEDPAIGNGHTDYISSNKTFEGWTPIPADKTNKNDDKASATGDILHPESDWLGLDWRFSHDLGLMQVDVDKACTDPVTNFACKDGTPALVFGHTAKQLLDPSTNISTALDIYIANSASCSDNLQHAFNAYNRGPAGCTSADQTYGTAVLALYNSCKAGAF